MGNTSEKKLGYVTETLPKSGFPGLRLTEEAGSGRELWMSSHMFHVFYSQVELN